MLLAFDKVNVSEKAETSASTGLECLDIATRQKDRRTVTHLLLVDKQHEQVTTVCLICLRRAECTYDHSKSKAKSQSEY